MPDHCQYCFWNFMGSFETEEDYEEAEECGAWTINIA